MYEIIKDIALQAGDIAMKHHGKVKKQYKAEEDTHWGNLVTQADLEIDDFIASQLQEYFPNHNICGEESGLLDKQSEYTWYIDPIDGTHNFTHDIPIWCVSFGLTKKKKPHFGLMYFPELEILAYAESGKGAFVNDEPIHVSSQKDLSKSIYQSPSFQYRKELQMSLNLAKESDLTVMHICCCFDLLQIARGNSDFSFFCQNPWDTTSGAIMVQEAGGKITDQKNQPWMFDSESLVVSNGHLHDQILPLIQDHPKIGSRDFSPFLSSADI